MIYNPQTEGGSSLILRCCLSQLGSTASLLQRPAWVCSASGGPGGIINNVNKAVKTNMISPKGRLDVERRNLSVTKRARAVICYYIRGEKTLSSKMKLLPYSSLHINTGFENTEQIKVAEKEKTNKLFSQSHPESTTAGTCRQSVH